MKITALVTTTLLAGSVGAQLVAYPHGTPLCTANDGGMFGYSVALTSVGGWTWLATGKPWDSSVHLLKTPTINLNVSFTSTSFNVSTCANMTMTQPSSFTAVFNASDSSNTTIVQSCYNTTNTNTTVNVDNMPSVTWTNVTVLRAASTIHDWNNTMASSPLSLFGYDVKWSTDGLWLAIGVPGRSYDAFASLPSPQLMWHAYHGSVVLYKRVNNAMVYHSELSASMARTARFFDRFGSKLLFSPDATSEFLFVVSNGGWDGVSAPGVRKSDSNPPLYGSDAASGVFPGNPTTSTDNLGVYVFRYHTTTGTWLPNTNGPFLRAKSPVPLGMLGIDIAVAGTTRIDTVLAVRDYMPDNVNNASGIVVLYRWDVAALAHREIATIKSADYGSDSNWQHEDWFGYGLSLVFDSTTNAGVLNVGAPRRGKKAYSIVSTRWRMWDIWSAGNHVNNPSSQSRTFFGGTLAVSSPNRTNFLFVSDATSNTGAGAVYMYHRRSMGEIVNGYENVVRAANRAGLFIYDQLATFAKANTTTTTASQLFKQDHFGKAMATQGNIMVVSAPVEDCIYTYALPATYIQPGFVPPNDLPNATISKLPEPTNDINSDGTIPENKTMLYAIIGAAAGFLLFGSGKKVPTTLWLVMRSHKKKLLAQLKAQAAVPPNAG